MKTRDREDRLSKQINAICLELTAADEDEIADRIVFDHLWLVMIRDYPDLETAEELASLMAGTQPRCRCWRRSRPSARRRRGAAVRHRRC